MSFSRPGAVDLSALKNRANAPAGTPSAPSAGGAAPGAVYVLDATEQNFQEVVQSSMHHIVVLALWSPRSPQSQDFADLLVQVAAVHEGAIEIARVDVDANPGIAQALQAQAVPLTIGLVQGRPVPLFQGTVAAEDITRYFDELVRLAAQNGLTGRAAPAGDGADQEPAADEPLEDPRFAAVDAAYAAGDFDTAVRELEQMAVQAPADDEIALRLAGTRLMARVSGADLTAARQAAAEAPNDVPAQLLVADLDVTGGHVDDAFDRLLTLVPRVFGDDRELVRQRLLDLFAVVGPTDPRVAQARRRLATALF